MRKISAAILDFGMPLLDLVPPDAPLKTQRHALSTVILVWNAIIVDAAEGTSHLADARKSLGKLPLAGRALFARAFDELVVRKERDFRDDKRLVGNWELRVGPNGAASLWVEACALGTAAAPPAPPAPPMIKPRFR